MANGDAAPDEAPAGRSMEFNDAATKVRSPQFRTLQNTVGNFRRTSVLDNLMPSRNALGNSDWERSKMGINRSAIGQSDTTFDKGLWLRSERPPDLYKTFG